MRRKPYFLRVFSPQVSSKLSETYKENGYPERARSMIISNQQVQAILRLYETAKTKAPAKTDLPEVSEKTNGEQVGDRAELSDHAQLFQKVREAALSAPEVREDLVERVKEEINKGSYGPEPEKIAEKILNRFLIDRII